MFRLMTPPRLWPFSASTLFYNEKSLAAFRAALAKGIEFRPAAWYPLPR
jgi:hypothetical protein